MIIQSLKETFRHMVRTPVIWIPGIILGLFAAGDLLIQYYAGSFMAGRLWVVELAITPFFIGGLMYTIREGKKDIHTFASGGKHYFFRILLPGIFIIIATIVTIALLSMSLELIGTPPVTGTVFGVVLGVSVPVIFLTYFYDAAAVFEDARVFDSIKRSIDMVLSNIGQVFAFYLTNIAIVIAGAFVLLIIWTALFFSRLEPLAEMNATQIQEFTFEQMYLILGVEGLWISALIYMIGILFVVTFSWTYKSCFFRIKAHGSIPVSRPEGEYDSKGRWYRY